MKWKWTVLAKRQIIAAVVEVVLAILCKLIAPEMWEALEPHAVSIIEIVFGTVLVIDTEAYVSLKKTVEKGEL